MKGGNDVVCCARCGSITHTDGITKDGFVCVSCKEGEQVPLLTIEVKDMNSIPIVKYKGEELEGKVTVDYSWATKNNNVGKHEYKMEYVEKETHTVKTISEKRIGG